jgi:hypothetical protein
MIRLVYKVAQTRQPIGKVAAILGALTSADWADQHGVTLRPSERSRRRATTLR